MDFVLLLLLWACFAGLITVHVALAVSVGQRRGPLWGWLGLLLFPLLPYFAFKANVSARAFLWLVLALAYPALLILAMR